MNWLPSQGVCTPVYLQLVNKKEVRHWSLAKGPLQLMLLESTTAPNWELVVSSSQYDKRCGGERTPYVGALKVVIPPQILDNGTHYHTRKQTGLGPLEPHL